MSYQHKDTPDSFWERMRLIHDNQLHKQACNKQPGDDHPFAGSGVACHFADEHIGPCSWALQPSIARQAVDRLLTTFVKREVEWIDAQAPQPILATDMETHEVSELTTLPAGPWVLVKFVGSMPMAIWKETGATYEMDIHGAVAEDPFLGSLT